MNWAQGIDFNSLVEPVALRLLGEPAQKRGHEWRYGNRGSLSIDIANGRWFDHEANEGGGVFDLIKRQGHEQPAAWLHREGLLATPRVVARPRPQIVETYPYCDESGVLLFQVVRYEPKDFRQRKPDGRGGWIWNLQDTRRVPYLLPELVKAVAAGETIYVPEGEKDVKNLRAIGFAATTNPGGCKKWRDEYSEYLRGANVIVLPDNHAEGREHGDQVVASLRGIAKRIRVLDIGKHWAECPNKGDISAWLAAGGSAEKLRAITDALPEVTTSADNASSQWRLVAQRASEISPRSIEWLWPGRIARGKHTAVAGEPGDGKSQLSVYVAATISKRREWPCNEGRAPGGNVIILNAEDGVDDTIVPRLIAAGADLDRVHIVRAVVQTDGNGRRTFNLQADLALLEQEIRRIGDVVLVIIDPISSYMGKTDSHKNSEVRGALEPLSEMAERLKVGILSITHFSKAGSGNTNKALHRFIGSIAFVGAPRAAFAAIEDADNEGRMLLLHAKNNMAPKAQGLAYRLLQTIVCDNIVASYVHWEDTPVTISADQALGAAEEEPGKRGAQEEAEEFLQENLSKGAVAVKDMEEHARALGISPRTLARARKKLGVVAEKGGMDEGWTWRLPSPGDNNGHNPGLASTPPKDAKPAEECHSGGWHSSGTLASFGAEATTQGRSANGGNGNALADLGIPDSLRRCDHCGQSGAPADPLRPWDWPSRPDGIRLHGRCEEPWHDAHHSRGDGSATAHKQTC
jgi:hypothetical protein